MKLKHITRIEWKDLPGIEAPSLARSRIGDHSTGRFAPGVGEIQGLDKALERYRFSQGHSALARDPREACFWLLSCIAQGEFVLIYDREEYRAPMCSALRWRTENHFDGFRIPDPDNRIAWLRFPLEGRWVADFRLPMRLNSHIERCLAKGRRDAACHRNLPERLWWGLWERGWGTGQCGGSSAPEADGRPWYERAWDEARRVGEGAVEGVVKTAKTAWEALPLTGDEASTTAARERIGKGVLGTLDGMATLIGPSAEEIITARETGNPDAMAYVEQRQQEQKEMARTLGDGVEQEFDKVHERSGTAGVVGALGAMTAIVVVSKGVGAVVGKAFSKVKVTAKAQVGEHVFHDTNQGARPAALADSAKPTLIAAKVDARNQKLKPGRGPTPNGNMADAHAEVGAIQQAHDAGVAKGADMVMEVEGRDVCGFCKSDIPAMAEKAELKSLKITSTDDKGVVRNYYWQPGAKLKEIK